MVAAAALLILVGEKEEGGGCRLGGETLLFCCCCTPLERERKGRAIEHAGGGVGRRLVAMSPREIEDAWIPPYCCSSVNNKVFLKLCRDDKVRRRPAV
jgi:hypothetical protein